MLIAIPNVGVQKAAYRRASDIRELYAAGTENESNWAVVASLGAEGGSVNLATGLSQADAEEFAHRVATAIGVAWRE